MIDRVMTAPRIVQPLPQEFTITPIVPAESLPNRSRVNTIEQRVNFFPLATNHPRLRRKTILDEVALPLVQLRATRSETGAVPKVHQLFARLTGLNQGAIVSQQGPGVESRIVEASCSHSLYRRLVVENIDSLVHSDERHRLTDVATRDDVELRFDCVIGIGIASIPTVRAEVARILQTVAIAIAGLTAVAGQLWSPCLIHIEEAATCVSVFTGARVGLASEPGLALGALVTPVADAI
jgi:hypothetical protein